MDQNKLIGKLSEINDRLKQANLRVKIQVRGKQDWLYLRATLPPKEKSGIRPYQQRLSTGIALVDQESLDRAFALAQKLGAQINLGEFRWEDWTDTRVRVTVADYIELMEAKFWEDNDEANPAHHETWRVGYYQVLKTLPASKELTAELLAKWVPPKTTPGTHREHYVARANQLAELAGLSIRFKNVARSKPRHKRDLPQDDRLIELYESTSGSDQWILGVLIAYGLRGHELFGLDYSEYPNLIVRHTAKTGARIVLPVYPEGCNWDLSLYRQPAAWARISAGQDWDKPTRSNSSLGTLVTRLFMRRDWEMRPYDLRHQFGRRCKARGLDEWLTAKLMGHTERVHRATYQHSFGDRFFLDLAMRRLNT